MSDDFSPYGLNHVAQARRKLERGEPCRHPGCLSHVSHPCEGCGRVGGTITLEEALAIEAENKRLAEENARLKAELAALKARRCETCRHCKQWTTSDGEPRAACTRLSDAHKVIEFVVPERDGCSRWQDKETADG